MDCAAGQVDLCTTINTIPNTTVDIERILDSFTPTLEELILYYICVRDEHHIYYLVHGDPHKRVRFIHVLQPYAFAEVLKGDPQQMSCSSMEL